MSIPLSLIFRSQSLSRNQFFSRLKTDLFSLKMFSIDSTTYIQPIAPLSTDQLCMSTHEWAHENTQIPLWFWGGYIKRFTNCLSTLVVHYKMVTFYPRPYFFVINSKNSSRIHWRDCWLSFVKLNSDKVTCCANVYIYWTPEHSNRISKQTQSSCDNIIVKIYNLISDKSLRHVAYFYIAKVFHRPATLHFRSGWHRQFA